MSVDDALRSWPELAIDHDNKFHVAAYLRRELVIDRCCACSRFHHPPRRMCPSCWSIDITPTPVSGAGTIYLLMWLHQGPATDGVDYQGGHPVATVELDEQIGTRFTATVTSCDRERVRIGARVRLTWLERDGLPWPAFELDGST